MDPAQWTSALNNPEFKEPQMTVIEQLRWKKYPVLNDGHLTLVDVMGDDAAIVQAARKSFGADSSDSSFDEKDRKTLRHMMREQHSSPFEMVELKFHVRVPMDCWRQWIRHRTANVNEHSTRYTEAIDSFQTTKPTEWRLQASSNKQGSEGFLEEWPEGYEYSEDFDNPHILTPNGAVNCPKDCTPGSYLMNREFHAQREAKELYQERLAFGIAKEQARKDLPLSTYTEAYWKCDLHNIFNFLRLRMDSHAQYEIRMYANAMAEIVKQVVPVAWEAFEDYVLYSKKFSRMEMGVLERIVSYFEDTFSGTETYQSILGGKPDSMTQREWKEFLEKLA